MYIRSYDDYVYSVDANSGKLMWKFKTTGHNTAESSLAAFAGTVYVGSNYDTSYDESKGHAAKERGYLDALDAATGKLKWEFLTENNIDSSPVVDNGSVYFDSNGVYALDNQNGKLKWKLQSKHYNREPLIISNGNLYYSDLCGGAPASLDKSCVYALDANNGSLKWKHEDGHVSLASDSMVFIENGGNPGYVYALDESNGNIKWSYQTVSPDTLFVSNRVLYLTTIHGDVSVNKRFEAKILMDNKTIPVLDGGDIEIVSSLEKDQYGIWGLPVMFTENGANKLRDAVIKYQVYNKQSDMVYYLDGEVVFKNPFSISLRRNIQSVPIRNIIINLGKDLDTENKTRAKELKEIFEGKTKRKAIGLDIYSGEPVPAATLTSTLTSFAKVAYVEGVTYKYGGDPPIYLYAIGEKASRETQTNSSKNVAGFEMTLTVIILSVLYILKKRRLNK